MTLLFWRTLVCLILCFSLCRLAFGAQNASQAFSFDFVDTPIAEVVRSVSLAYDTPVLVDDTLDIKVTFHLDGVGMLDALSALCSAYGLELVQEGTILHVRRAKLHGSHEFSWQDSLVSVSVKDKDVNEFIREFSLNSGLNILAVPGLEGRITGALRQMPAEDAFRTIMETHGFRVSRTGGCLRVEPPHRTDSEKRGGNGREGDNFRLERDGNFYSAEIDGVPLSKVLEELADISGLNLAVYGDIQENVHLKMQDASLESLVEALFGARRYSYVLEGQMLLVSEGGVRNALSTSTLYPLRHLLLA